MIWFTLLVLAYGAASFALGFFACVWWLCLATCDPESDLMKPLDDGKNLG